jgi:hypothetical protein
VRFEGGATDDDDELEAIPLDPGNGWYFYAPLVMIGIWAVVGVARIVAVWLVPQSIVGAPHWSDGARGVRLATDVVDWLGGLGWVLVFLFSFLLISRKRFPAWFCLAAFCPGPNLLLYIALLLMPKHRPTTAAAPSTAAPLEMEKAPRPSALLLKDSFVCESCDSLLNYGVSQCRECGELYRYVDGKPLVADSAQRER